MVSLLHRATINNKTSGNNNTKNNNEKKKKNKVRYHSKSESLRIIQNHKLTARVCCVEHKLSLCEKLLTSCNTVSIQYNYMFLLSCSIHLFSYNYVFAISFHAVACTTQKRNVACVVIVLCRM